MRKVANVLLIITNILVFFGVIFKSMHWPGATVGLVFGITLSVFGMLFYFIARFRKKSEVKITTYYVYFFFFVMTHGVFTFAIGNTRDVLNAFAMLDQGTNSINNQMAENAKLFNVSANVDVVEYSKLVHELCDLIDEDKKRLVDYTGGVDDMDIPLGKDNMDDAATYFSYDKDHAKHLTVRLEKLNNLGVKIMGSTQFLLVEDLRNVSYSYDPAVISGWVERMTHFLPLSSVLANLELVKTRFLQNQLTILNSINRN